MENEFIGNVNEDELEAFRQGIYRGYEKEVQPKVRSWHTWSKQAIDCYLSNYDCDNCKITKHYGISYCRMKETIKTLIGVYGIPKEVTQERLYREGKKLCIGCGEVKSQRDFSPVANTWDGLQTYCKACCRKKDAQRRKKFCIGG